MKRPCKHCQDWICIELHLPCDKWLDWMEAREHDIEERMKMRAINAGVSYKTYMREDYYG
jgi:hypothetical protein